jgi:glycosyltransferase involved in cell wall biosynthesis
LTHRKTPRERFRVAIVGIDNFSRKNISQVVCMNERGYLYDVFTNDRIGDSRENLPPGNQLQILATGFASRTRQLYRYFRDHADSLNHVEVYPGGRYAGIVVLLARRFKLPVITVERGDIKRYARHDSVTRWSMRTCYRRADIVWFREFYAEKLLRSIGATQLFFLANAVAPGDPENADRQPTIDFLWVNRLVPERRVDWFVEVMARPEFSHLRSVIAGLKRQQSELISGQQQYVQANCPDNVELMQWTDPISLYRTSRFFVLPSDLVFCNNSLLEAMSWGVVPLVSDVEGADLIVRDGVNGFRFPHTKEGFHAAVQSALTLAPERYAEMSAQAIATVRSEFSVHNYIERLAALYASVPGLPATSLSREPAHS